MPREESTVATVLQGKMRKNVQCCFFTRLCRFSNKLSMRWIHWILQSPGFDSPKHHDSETGDRVSVVVPSRTHWPQPPIGHHSPSETMRWGASISCLPLAGRNFPRKSAGSLRGSDPTGAVTPMWPVASLTLLAAHKEAALRAQLVQPLHPAGNRDRDPRPSWERTPPRPLTAHPRRRGSTNPSAARPGRRKWVWRHCGSAGPFPAPGGTRELC